MKGINIMEQDYYQILGIDRDANIDVIKKAFRKKAAEVHPDKGGSEEEFNKIHDIYEVLMDEDKRKEYDITGCVDNKFDVEKEAETFLTAIFRRLINDNNTDYIVSAKSVVNMELKKIEKSQSYIKNRIGMLRTKTGIVFPKKNFDSEFFENIKKQGLTQEVLQKLSEENNKRNLYQETLEEMLIEEEANLRINSKSVFVLNKVLEMCDGYDEKKEQIT